VPRTMARGRVRFGRPFLTPPNFAPDGRDPPAETLVGTAVSRRLLARRKPGVQIPSPPPPNQQVRASPASSRRRSLQVAVQPGRPSEITRLGPGPPTTTTERSRRLQPELRVRCDARQSGPEATLAQAAGRAVRGCGRTARPGPLLAVGRPAAPTRSTRSPMQTQRTRDAERADTDAGTGRPHPDIGQRTRGHRMRGHCTVAGHWTPNAWTRPRPRTGRPRHGRHPDRHRGPHDHPTARWDAQPWTCGRRLRRSPTMTTRRR
jgi:hypothetical protein